MRPSVSPFPRRERVRGVRMPIQYIKVSHLAVGMLTNAYWLRVSLALPLVTNLYWDIRLPLLSFLFFTDVL